MSRAQDITADQFADVLGMRRGIRPDQERSSFTPRAIGAIAAYRRLTLLGYMVAFSHSHSVETLVSELTIFTDDNASGTIGEAQEQEDALCLADLEYLVEEGLCYSEDELNEVGDVMYRSYDVNDWPVAHFKAYLDWRSTSQPFEKIPATK